MTIPTVSIDTPVWASHYNQLVNAINAGTIKNVGTISELKALDTTSFAEGFHFNVADYGLYKLNKSSTLQSDGELIIDSDVAGQFQRVAAPLEKIYAEIMPFFETDERSELFSVDFGSTVSAQFYVARIVDFSFVEPFDDVKVIPPPNFPVGLILTAFCSDVGKITVHVQNYTASNRSIGKITFKIIVRK